MKTHTRDIIGQIYDDRRVLSKAKTNKRGTTWLTECIYCHEHKIMTRDKLTQHVGTTCPQCTNIQARVTDEELIELTSLYDQGIPVKEIAYQTGLSLRTIYNHITPERRTHANND